MSKIIDIAKLSKIPGKRVYDTFEKVDVWSEGVLENKIIYQEVPILEAYRLEARIGTSFMIKEQYLEQAEKDAVAKINRYVYGNIEQKLDELRFYIYEGNRQKCFDIIDQIYKECGRE